MENYWRVFSGAGGQLDQTIKFANCSLLKLCSYSQRLGDGDAILLMTLQRDGSQVLEKDITGLYSICIAK